MTKTVARFVEEHFPGLVLRAPTFYAWPIALRFELARGVQGFGGSRQQALRRVEASAADAASVFEACVAPDDAGWLVAAGVPEADWSRFFSLVKGSAGGLETPDGIRFDEEGEPYEYRVVAVDAPLRRIDYRALADGTARQDSGLPGRLPMAVWVVVETRPLVFHQYDDRGVDVLAPSAERLRPIYREFREWVMDHDRERIETAMGER